MPRAEPEERVHRIDAVGTWTREKPAVEHPSEVTTPSLMVHLARRTDSRPPPRGRRRAETPESSGVSLRERLPDATPVSETSRPPLQRKKDLDAGNNDQKAGSNLRAMDVLDFEGWNNADWNGVFAHHHTEDVLVDWKGQDPTRGIREHIDAMKAYVDSVGSTPARITHPAQGGLGHQAQAHPAPVAL